MTLNHTTRLPAVDATPGVVWPDDPAAVRPLHFGDAAAEYTAAAIVCDVHDRVQVVATGSDAVPFLNSFCTAKLVDLQPGEGTEAFFPNIKGRVVAHALVFRGEDNVYLSADPGTSDSLLTHLRTYKLAEDVELIDSTGAWGELLVAGSGAAHVIETVTGIAAGDLGRCGHREGEIQGDRVIVRNVPMLDVPSFTLAAETTTLDRLWPSLAAVAQTAGEAVFQPRRIAAGWPQLGLDITDAHLVQEVARTDRAVSFEKGCYLGQEPIARLDAMGHTNRELRTLRIVGESPIGDGVVGLGESEVGRVSSSAAVPGEDATVALAVVKKKAAAEGTAVTVDGREAVVHRAAF